ncbi:ATP cone domain-containing protein, partial [Pseudomonas yamanorum]|uniref:ATP cone domain-containing protein n=1 Tax=Pseudomonas yamanorum TaxID=515393 RepID=UPI00384ECFE3
MQTDTTRENPQGSVPQAADSNLDLSATAPGQLRVIKRNGTVVPYTDDKITVAITKAFLAVEGGTAAASSRIHDTVARLTEQVTATFKRRMPSGGTIHPNRPPTPGAGFFGCGWWRPQGCAPWTLGCAVGAS